MAKPVDLELKMAFQELQAKMVETCKKIQVIDSKIEALKDVTLLVAATKKEITNLPPGTRTYEAVGRTYILTDIDVVETNLNNRESKLTIRTKELENSKQYLEKKLKESEDNIREMVQQRKEQIEVKAN